MYGIYTQGDNEANAAGSKGVWRSPQRLGSMMVAPPVTSIVLMPLERITSDTKLEIEFSHSNGACLPAKRFVTKPAQMHRWMRGVMCLVVSFPVMRPRKGFPLA